VTLPTLYKKTSTGAIQTWSVEFFGKQYCTTFGQENGNLQTSEPTACVGKQGRSDEEQAEFEAKALWTKKLKKDYVRTREEALAGGSSELVKGGILPMLAHKFSEHGDKLKYPCFVQPKLDGHRCIGMPDGYLWSRTRKLITGAPHVNRDVRLFDSKFPLDGELYNHAYRDRFEQLSHFIRQRSAAEGCEVVEFHIYDLAEHRMPFRERIARLQSRFAEQTTCPSPLKLVETREVNNEDELMLAFEDFLAQGYEGAIARNADGLYVNKRSYDLLKIKQFDDGEFQCVAVEEGVGKMAGHAVFVCQNTHNSFTFRAKMKGEHAVLRQYFARPELVVGKMVTVKYQGLTNKNGVPRFPVALRIREDV